MAGERERAPNRKSMDAIRGLRLGLSSNAQENGESEVAEMGEEREKRGREARERLRSNLVDIIFGARIGLEASD